MLRCRKAAVEGTSAYRFRKWVTSEVLPQIRKTGRYVREELSQADKARMLAQEMTSSMLPAIMDALQVEQKHYTFLLTDAIRITSIHLMACVNWRKAQW